MELSIFLLLIPVIRGLIFFFDWRYLVEVCDKHNLYLKGVGESATDEAKEASGKASDWITEHATEIKRRVEKSGIQNPVHSYMDAKGYGYVGQEQISTLDNLLYLNETIQNSAVMILKKARGHFRNEAIKSLNPLFWLETLFFLPKAIVSASGIDASSKLADTGLKVTQIIYWLVILGAVIANPDLLKVLIETIKT